MDLRAVRGMHDLFGDEMEQWNEVEFRISRFFRAFGYQEIRTPVLERIEVFKGTVGEETDIVEKQMYQVEKESSEKLVLRPEGTASFIRAIAEHQLYQIGKPQRYFYYLPMFRHERPQKGRLRQFHQFGAELLNETSAEADAEIIFLLDQLLRSFQLKDYKIEVNSVGCPECRMAYREILKKFLTPIKSLLCADCQARFERSTLRVLDCKKSDCKAKVASSPKMVDHLCNPCRDHYAGLKRALSGTQTGFVENPNIVRGLDYYIRTAFEFTSDYLGAQNALGAGGRYDGMGARFGVKELPAVGFGMGMERLMIALNETQLVPKVPRSRSIFLAALGRAALNTLYPLSLRLKGKGILAHVNYEADRGLKGCLKQADRLNCDYAAILGDNEIQSRTLILKNLRTGTQETIELNEMESTLERRMTSEA